MESTKNGQEKRRLIDLRGSSSAICLLFPILFKLQVNMSTLREPSFCFGTSREVAKDIEMTFGVGVSLRRNDVSFCSPGVWLPQRRQFQLKDIPEWLYESLEN